MIAVEPAGGGTNSAPATAAASGPSQAANAPTPEDATKLAAAESKGAEEATPQAAKTTEAPLPQGASRQELAQDILAELKRIAINANWGARSQLALDRFNRLAALELPLDEPQQASLDALRGWKGARCPIEKAVPPRFKQRPVVVVPRKEVPPRKAVRAGPPKAPPVQAFQPRPRPQDHGSDEQRELQRAFPSTAWPDQ